MDDAVEEPGINTFVQLPAYMREANRGLFEPRVLSIGPYHHGRESTRDMEAHKEHILQGFLQRPGNANHAYYVQEVIARCFAQARRCYVGNVDSYTVEMLTRDGCFIVELLLRWSEGTAHVDNYVWLMWNSVYYDLLLFDNQIPFFVLDRIFRVFVAHNANQACFNNNVQLLHLVRIFFNHRGQFSWANLNDLNLPNASQVRHLLDLQYKLVISNNLGIEADRRNGCLCRLFCCNIVCHRPSMPRGIPGANELQDYGVGFRAKRLNERVKLFDVTFRGKTMNIPRFEINFGSKILLANLFAYDQQIACQPAAAGNAAVVDQLPGNNGEQGRNNNNVGVVTSYVVLMNALVNSRDDVVVLQEEGVLDNMLSNEEEVASFFNNLGRCVLVDVTEHRYSRMFQDVNRYWRNGMLRKYSSIFCMKHCKTPLTCLSLLAAILLLIFSCTSMIFAILKYTRD